MWDQLGSLAKCSACFLTNPQFQKKRNECHSYYHRQLQAARCQGNCEVHTSKGVVGSWQNLVVKLEFKVLQDRETSPNEAVFSS